MAFSGSQITRLGAAGIPRGLYGSFSGREAAEVSPSPEERTLRLISPPRELVLESPSRVVILISPPRKA